MASVQRLVLDVLKPHQPNTLEFARAIAALGEGSQVDIRVFHRHAPHVERAGPRGPHHRQARDPLPFGRPLPVRAGLAQGEEVRISRGL